MTTTTLTQGTEEYETQVTFKDGLNIDAGTVTLGTKKFQVFAGSLADTNGGTTQYADNDILVELGALDTTIDATNLGIVAATKIFIDKVKILVTTASGETLVGNLQLSATSGTATNSAVSSGTEIVGAGAALIDPQISAAPSVTEVDINFNSAGVHVLDPNITVASSLVNLYACTTTTLNSNTSQQGRFTVMIEYTVF